MKTTPTCLTRIGDSHHNITSSDGDNQSFYCETVSNSPTIDETFSFLASLDWEEQFFSIVRLARRYQIPWRQFKELFIDWHREQQRRDVA